MIQLLRFIACAEVEKCPFNSQPNMSMDGSPTESRSFVQTVSSPWRAKLSTGRRSRTNEQAAAQRKSVVSFEDCDVFVENLSGKA